MLIARTQRMLLTDVAASNALLFQLSVDNNQPYNAHASEARGLCYLKENTTNQLLRANLLRMLQRDSLNARALGLNQDSCPV